MEGVGYRHVGRQRHPSVAVLTFQTGVEAQLPPLLGELEHLLGELDSRRAATILGGDDSPGQLGEGWAQCGHVDVLVRQLVPAADDGALGAVEPRPASGIDAHGEHDGRTRSRGQQAGRPLGQRRRVERHLAVRQVHRAAALPGRPVEHAVRVDEEADVGDGVVQDDVVAGLLGGERLVEIGGGRRVERRVLDRRAIDVRSTGHAGGHFLGGRDDLGRELPRHSGLGPDRSESGGDRPIDDAASAA